MTSTQDVESSVTTNNSPSNDYTNPDDQPAKNTDSPGSQPTTVLLMTTPTRTSNQPRTLTHLGHNQQHSSQDYTNPDEQPATSIDSPGSQPTTVLLRTTPAMTIDQPQTLTHLGHNQQQRFSGLHQPGRSTNHKH